MKTNKPWRLGVLARENTTQRRKE